MTEKQLKNLRNIAVTLSIGGIFFLLGCIINKTNENESDTARERASALIAKQDSIMNAALTKTDSLNREIKTAYKKGNKIIADSIKESCLTQQFEILRDARKQITQNWVHAHHAGNNVR